MERCATVASAGFTMGSARSSVAVQAAGCSLSRNAGASRICILCQTELLAAVLYTCCWVCGRRVEAQGQVVALQLSA